MKPTKETSMNYFNARLESASVRMNFAARNYQAAAKYADAARAQWLKVQWESQ